MTPHPHTFLQGVSMSGRITDTPKEEEEEEEEANLRRARAANGT